MECYKKQGKLHRKFAFQILLEIHQFFSSQPSLVDINVPEGRSNQACGSGFGKKKNGSGALYLERREIFKILLNGYFKLFQMPSFLFAYIVWGTKTWIRFFLPKIDPHHWVKLIFFFSRRTARATEMRTYWSRFVMLYYEFRFYEFWRRIQFLMFVNV